MSIKSKRRKKHKRTWFLIVFVTGAAEHCLGLQRAFHAAIYVNEIVLFSQWSVRSRSNMTTKHFSHPAFVSVTADGRPRQHSTLLTAWLVRGFLPLPRTAGAKTNLPMCLRRCESSSLGRFAERLLTCLDLSAAKVPCETAPFASFSGRTEKEGPARPERGPIFSSLIKVMEKF